MSIEETKEKKSFLARAVPPFYTLAQWISAFILTLPTMMGAIWLFENIFNDKSVSDAFLTSIFLFLLISNYYLLKRFKESCFIFICFLLLLLVVSPGSFLYLKYNYEMLFISKEKINNKDKQQDDYKPKTHEEKLLYVNDSNR